jgi:hypothetical protein
MISALRDHWRAASRPGRVALAIALTLAGTLPFILPFVHTLTAGAAQPAPLPPRTLTITVQDYCDPPRVGEWLFVAIYNDGQELRGNCGDAPPAIATVVQ